MLHNCNNYYVKTRVYRGGFWGSRKPLLTAKEFLKESASVSMQLLNYKASEIKTQYSAL